MKHCSRLSNVVLYLPITIIQASGQHVLLQPTYLAVCTLGSEEDGGHKPQGYMRNGLTIHFQHPFRLGPSFLNG